MKHHLHMFTPQGLDEAPLSLSDKLGANWFHSGGEDQGEDETPPPHDNAAVAAEAEAEGEGEAKGS